MALTIMDRLRPLRYLGSGGIPTLEVVKATGVTWPKGALVVSNTGLAVQAADSPVPTTILGIAAEPAVTGVLSALIIPALPGITFWGRMGTGGDGDTYDTAIADRYLSGAGGYDICLGALDMYYIDEGLTVAPQAVILNFIDPMGTAWGAVEWTFASSAFNSIVA